MKIVRMVSFAALIVAVGTLVADDKKYDMQAAMTAMMQHGTPGDAHKVFESYAGKWTYTGKWYMPDGKAMEMAGTADSKIDMDGRFYSEHVKGNDPKMPFEGKGWWGYDNAKKKYWFCWIDSMTTSLGQGEGTWDKANNTMTWTSEMYDPYEKKNCKMKEVQVVKADTIDRTFYRVEGGKDRKEMELHCTRAK
ncbi:MAG: DUF1579 family protein [Gemmataceae bacterium]